MTESQQPTERRGPGRPRVPEVIERDEKVFALVSETGPLQVREIAEKLAVKKSAAYLSLWRLRREGRVAYARNGAHRLWSVS